MKWLRNRRNLKREGQLQMVKAETKLLSAATRHMTLRFGNGGSKRTAGAKSPGGLSNSGMTRVFDHQEIRNNARDAMFDSVVGRGMTTRFADTIADTGLKAKFEPDAVALKMTPEKAEEWGRMRSKEFHNYMMSKDSSLNGINNGYQNQWLYSYEQQRDNDMYVRLHYTSDPDLISPVQQQFLDPDQLAGFCYTDTNGTPNQSLNHGIKYDGKGREVSFTFLVANGTSGFDEVTIPKKGRRSKRQYVIHGFRPEYAGQKQGFSLITHQLQELEDITTLKMSHIQKAIMQSQYGFYTKPSQDADASAGPDDYAGEAVEVVQDFLGTDGLNVAGVEAAAEEGLDELNNLTFSVLNEQAVRQVGSIWNTSHTAGETMEAVKQTAPVDGFGDFVDSLVGYMSASSGMPIEVLKMKFGQNYSASRATLVLFWRIVNMWRAEMIADYLNPLAQAWLSEEIASGRVKAPGWSDPRIKQSWLTIRWVGSSVPNIDPKKEAEAAGLRATLGHETLDDGALKHNGSDGTTNRAKLTKEIPELPIGPWSKNYAALSNDGSEDEDKDEDEDKGDDDEK